MTISASTIAVDDTRTLTLFDDLPRVQMVMYSGVSGDYNPIHTDEPYSTEIAGYPSVFAHGMLTMGATGRVVTDWFGTDSVKRYSARFVGQVWPGDTLTAHAKVEAVREEDDGWYADVAVYTMNQSDAPVLTGAATVRLDA